MPGTVAGFWKAHQRYGSLPWEDLVAPAIKLAEEGFMPADVLVSDIHGMHAWFGETTNFNDYFARIRAGELFKQPELAETLKRIAANGADEFYSGETAKMLVAQMGRSNGLITAEDLENYEAIWRAPLRATWRDYEIVSAPPPSSGGFAIIQLLKMKDNLEHYFEGVEHNSPQY
ncbi:MAG: gamma-glutamyltransferase, partial [Woeseiales bacterium]